MALLSLAARIALGASGIVASAVVGAQAVPMPCVPILDARGVITSRCTPAERPRDVWEARAQRFRELRESAGREGDFKRPQTDPWAGLTPSAPAPRPAPTAPEDIRQEHRGASQVRSEFERSGQLIERSNPAPK